MGAGVCLLALLFGLHFPGRAIAVPAFPGTVEVAQPDGHRFKLRRHGDEFFSWDETEEGYAVVQESADGVWRYATTHRDRAEFRAIPGARVGFVAPEALGLTKHARPSAEALRNHMRTKGRARRELNLPLFAPESAAPGATSAEPSDPGEPPPSQIPVSGTKTIRNVVLLASFSDHWNSGAGTVNATKGRVDTNEYVNLFNQVNHTSDGAVGSVRDYYHEVSYGKLTVESIVSPWLQLPEPESYYGSDLPSTDADWKEMVTHAIDAAESAGYDFSRGDSDGDGWVDCLTIIHSGHGQEYSGNPSTTIWSKQGEIDSFVTKDGTMMKRCHTEPALRGSTSSTSINRIGVICHEMGHSFGLPDLYDYSSSTEGIGAWGLMASGSWNGSLGSRPAHFCAWSKSQLGFLKPIQMHARANVVLPRAEDNPIAHLYRDGMANEEYFLVENRARIGFDDDSRIYPGLLILHIDRKSPDNDLGTWLHAAVKIEEADGNNSLGAMTALSQSGDVWTSTSGLAGGFRDQTGNQSANAMRYQSHAYNRPDDPAYYSRIRVDGFSAAAATMTYDAATVKPWVEDNPGVGPAYTVHWGACTDATTYEIQEGTRTTVTTFNDGAEDEDAMFENWYPTGDVRRDGDGSRSGSYSYAMHRFYGGRWFSTVQSLILREPFTVTTSSVLSYYLKSHLSSGSGSLQCQISNDDGNSWNTLSTDSGYINSWSLRSYDYTSLNAAGISTGDICTIRFIANWERASGLSSFPGYGFAVDDISLTGIERDGYTGWTGLDSNVSTESYAITGKPIGEYAYQVRAYVNGAWQGFGSVGVAGVTATQSLASVYLQSLIHTYDGSPKSAIATTDPAGLTVELTYNGSTHAPSDVGSYAVTGTVVDTNYAGSTNGTLTITAADQALDFPAIPDQISTNTVVLAATASSGLEVTFAVAEGPATLTDGATLTFTGAGTVRVTADQPGDTNWNATATLTNSFTVTKAVAAVTLGSLNQTYDGSARPVTVTTDPPGLSVMLSYDGATDAPTNTGVYAVTGVITDLIYQGTTNGTLTITAAGQTLDFTAIPDQLSTNTVLLAASASSDLDVTFAVAEGPATLAGGATLTFTGAGTVRITADQPGDANWNAAATLTNSFTVTKAAAAVTLGSLNQTYDGSARPVTVTTDPPGLSVTLTYDGAPAAPTNTGVYAVTGAITDLIYQGTTNGTLTITAADQTLDFPAIPDQISTNTVVLAATASSGLDVTFAVAEGPATLTDGATLTFTGAGTVRVTADQPGDANWNAAATLTNSFTVTKAVAAVTLGSLNQTYDGSARPVTVTTDPPGLSVTLSYDGSPAAPTNTGSYAVTGLITDLIYKGTTNGILTITAADQTLDVPAIPDQLSTNSVLLAASASSGLDVTFAVADGPATLTDSATLTFTGEGTVRITADQPGDTNWNAAATLTNSLTVTKAVAAVTLGSLNQTYDGSARPVTVTTDPPSLSVTLSYDGSPAAPTNTGSYAVTGVITDLIYQGTTNGTLTITAADQALDFPAIPDQLSTNTVLLAATASSGLEVTFAVAEGPATLTDGATLTFTGAGTVRVTAGQSAETNWNAAATLTNSFTVTKAVAAVTLGSLNQTYDGSARPVTVTTDPPGLSVTLTYDGAPAAPTNTGVYAVTGVITDLIYQGTTNGTLTITAADQALDFTAIPDQLSTNTVLLAASASSGLEITFAVAEGPATLTDGTTLTFTGAGTVRITADQAGDTNWNTAPTLTNSFTVTKAAAAVTLGSLNQTYDGSARPVTVTTDPPGLSVTLSYDGAPAAPTNTGVYAVTGAITDLIYQGTTNGTLTISKSTPVITWSSPQPIPYGTPLAMGIQLNATSSVAGAFTYVPPADTILPPGTGVVLQATLQPTDTMNFSTSTARVSITVHPTVEVTADPHGTVMPSGRVVVPFGSAADFVIQADLAYHIEALLTNGVQVVPASGHSNYTSMWSEVTAVGVISVTFGENVTSHGTPEWWLRDHGWTHDFETVASEDGDGDGVVTWREFVTDTDPRSRESVLAVTGIVPSDSGTVVHWKGGQAAWQYLDCLTGALPGAPWSCVFTNAPETTITNQYIHSPSTPAGPRFYRLRATRP